MGMSNLEEIQTSNGITVTFDCYEHGWVWRAASVPVPESGLPAFAIGDKPYEDDPYGDIEFQDEAMARVIDQVVTAWTENPVRQGHPIEVVAYDGWNILVDPVSDQPVIEDRGFSGILLRWKLAPAPPPALVDVTDEVAVAVRLRIIELEARTPDSVIMNGLEREDVSFGHDQRFGPLTPWVVANARVMLGLEEIDVLVARMEQVAIALNPKVNEAALSMIAVWSLRSNAMQRVRRMADRVVDRLTAREDWKDLVRHRADEIGRSRNWTRTYLKDLLREFVGNTLVACGMQDVMNEHLVMSATGAWRSVLSPHEDFPGELWLCSDSTTAVLKDFFADLDEDGLVECVMAMDDPTNSKQAQQVLGLIGSTLLRNASPPPLAELVGPGLRDLVQHRSARSLMDQIARFIAGIAEPPPGTDPADVVRLRRELTEAMGVRW